MHPIAVAEKQASSGSHNVLLSSTQSRVNTTATLSRGWYRAFWLIALSIHFSTGLVVFSLSGVHAILSLPVTQDNTSALLLPTDLLRTSALLYGVVAVLHIKSAVSMLVNTLRYGNVALRFSAVTSPTNNENKDKSVQPPSLVSGWWEAFKSFITPLRNVVDSVSINGPLFNAWLLFREVIEVAMQSFQLWILSYSVSRGWIKQFAVAAVVLNCWSLPIVSYLFRKHEPTRRLMHLAVDLCLDYEYTVIVPLSITVPYLMAFDWNRLAFPMYLVKNDVWLATALAEAKQVLVASYPDLISSCLPHYSMLACLSLLKRSIVCQVRGSSRSIAPVVPLSMPSESVVDASHKPGRTARYTSLLVMVWGVVVLGLHIDAVAVDPTRQIAGCQLFVQQWLPTNKSCSLLYINCQDLDIQGSTTEIEQILDTLERPVLTWLRFQRCPSLHVPPMIREFPALAVLYFELSAVSEWEHEAALTRTTSPVLASFFLYECRMSTIPRGIYHRELPPFLDLIVIHNSVIDAIPDDIGDVWRDAPMRAIRFESTNVKDMPVSFGRVRQAALSLTGNHITHFADDMFADARYAVVRLSGNPLQQLPNTIGDTSKLRELLVENTRM